MTHGTLFISSTVTVVVESLKNESLIEWDLKTYLLKGGGLLKSVSGGLAQSVECALCKREAPGSKPGFSTSVWSYSVMVITLDFESSDPGSNPGRTSFYFSFKVT